MELKENERIDDLQINNLKIIQNEDWFCFGIDSVLLSGFASGIHKDSHILDLGTGNGVLALLLSAKINNSKITGIEVQKEVVDMAKRSVKLNNLENKINVVCMDLKNLNNHYPAESFDAIVCNNDCSDSVIMYVTFPSFPINDNTLLLLLSMYQSNI